MSFISFLLKSKGYWQSRRNRGDFIVTFLGVVWIILNYTLNNHYIVIFGYLVILLRFCTITGIYIRSSIDKMKSLKIIWWLIFYCQWSSPSLPWLFLGKHSTLTMLIQTVIMSIYKSFFIISLMFLMITVYSLAGNILFGNIKYGEAINRHANFDTTLNGIQMLFRIVTGNAKEFLLCREC